MHCKIYIPNSPFFFALRISWRIVADHKGMEGWRTCRVHALIFKYATALLTKRKTPATVNFLISSVAHLVITYTRYTRRTWEAQEDVFRDSQLEEHDENVPVTVVTWKKRSVHLRRNISLSLYTSFISLCTGGPRSASDGKRGAEGWKNSQEVAKKNAKENANRPLDITGEMLPDLSRFYLAACLWQVLIRISSVPLSSPRPCALLAAPLL